MVPILLIIALVLLLKWLRCNTRYQRLLAKIPEPRAYPLIGHMHHLPSDPAEFVANGMVLTESFRKEGIFRLRMTDFLDKVLIFKAELMETILSSHEHITKSHDYWFVHEWLREGLLTSTGKKWHTRRRLLTPAFHFRILDDFLPVFNEQAEILVKKLRPLARRSMLVDVTQFVKGCTLDIICESAMGLNVDAQHETESEYVQAVGRMSELVHIRQKRPWLWPDAVYRWLPAGREHARCLRVLHSFSSKVIGERGETHLDGDTAACDENDNREEEEPLSRPPRNRGMALLDLLLHVREEAKLTHLDIREEIDTFMFEGHDTTAVALGWALYLIAKHPHVQRKVVEELSSVVGDNASPLTMADLKRLRYLECVIKEALRLYPSVPVIGRKLEKDVQLGEYLLPAGIEVILLILQAHRDPVHFPDPDEFRPERFLPENSVGRHPYAYIPFSAGPRNCIGQRFAMLEEKVILAWMLRHYHLTALHAEAELRPRNELILRSGRGVWLALRKRPQEITK